MFGLRCGWAATNAAASAMHSPACHPHTREESAEHPATSLGRRQVHATRRDVRQRPPPGRICTQEPGQIHFRWRANRTMDGWMPPRLTQHDCFLLPHQSPCMEASALLACWVLTSHARRQMGHRQTCLLLWASRSMLSLVSVPRRPPCPRRLDSDLRGRYRCRSGGVSSEGAHGPRTDDVCVYQLPHAT